MTVTLSTSNSVATITLNRPDSYHAFDWTSLEAFKQVLGQVQEDKTVRAIIITGTGKAFCARADLKELGTGDISRNIEQILFNGFNSIMTRLRTIEKPVIANLVISHDNLNKTALTTATRFAAMPIRAVDMMKQTLTFAAEPTLEESLVYEAQLQAKAITTKDLQEGVAAFNEKREPDFQGEQL